MARRIGRAIGLTFAILFGGCAGFFGGCSFHQPNRTNDYAFLAETVPLPHHVPQYAGHTSLRFAMVHDVIHERYPKHGRAYYEARNRVTRARLAPLRSDNPATFPMADDLAAELERLGDPDEAVRVMRDKLAQQVARDLPEPQRYTSYANLGTYLMSAHQSKAAAGDAKSRELFREGVEHVKKSVAVNDMAHFGRERWQIELGEFQWSAMTEGGTLRAVDFLGNRLGLTSEEILDRERAAWATGYGRAANHEFNQGRADWGVPAFFQPDARPDDPDQWQKLSPIRQYITKVGNENSRDDVNAPDHLKPVPFDEPVLGIVGMWRQGSGPNPHFALALGETMLRVGQRHIAWTAYERASRMADQFSPDPADREFLRTHCRKRQTDIEKSFATGEPPSGRHANWSKLSAAEIAGFRPRFEAELAHGERYQREYQDYEAKQIAAGVPPTDERFYDAFNAGRDPIASPVGSEERFTYVPSSKRYEYIRKRAWAWAAFGAGLMAFVTAGLLRWRSGRGDKVDPQPVVPSPWGLEPFNYPQVPCSARGIWSNVALRRGFARYLSEAPTWTHGSSTNWRAVISPIRG